jgi:non-specific serine/threonine protein kinase
VSHRANKQTWETATLAVLVDVSLRAGDYLRARSRVEECLRMARQTGHTWSLAMMTRDLGRIALGESRLHEARVLLEESLAAELEIRSQQGVSRTLVRLAQCELRQGEIHAAVRHAVDALRISRDIGERFDVAVGIAVLASVAARIDPAVATRLSSAALRQWSDIGAQPSDEDRVVLDGTTCMLREALGSEVFDDAWNAGQRLALQAAIDDALAAADAFAVQSQHPSRAVGSGRTLDHSHVTIDPLTPREREVAELVAQGLSNRQIARTLVIGEGTAGNHVQHILDKLGVHTRTQIAVWATEHGLTAKPNAADM